MYKQITYPKSHHCPRGRGELRSYLDDLEFATKFFNDNPDASAKAIALNKVITKKNAALNLARYAEPDSQVTQFLARHNDLVSVLNRSVPHLISYFGSKVACEFDLLEEGNQQKLFIKILTKLSAEEALERLDGFDKEWWFKEPVDARRRLEFVLEFQ